MGSIRINPVLRTPLLVAGIAAAVVDQATKLVVTSGDPGVGLTGAEALERTAIIPGLVYVDRLANSGIALGGSPGYGLLSGLILFLALGIVVANLALVGDVLPTRLNVALGLIVGGVLGNLIDRVRLGYVIDFIWIDAPILDWVVFDVADIALVVGLILLALEGPDPWRHYWRALRASRHIRGRRGQAARPGDPFGRD